MTSSPNEDLTAAIEKFGSDYRRVREQIGRAVVGHEEIVDGVLTCLFAGGHALLEGVPGRGSVATNDLKDVAMPALRHRCLLNFEAEAEGITTDEVIQNAIDTLPTEAVLETS